jgi:hypothetical protein
MAEKNHLRDFESTRTVFFAFAIFLLLAVFDHRRSRSITVDAARCRSIPLDPMTAMPALTALAALLRFAHA